MNNTDYHSHILPGLDDGAGDITESILMLRELYRQGVQRVYATPHFYADRESPEEFIRRREAAYTRIAPFLLQEDVPSLSLGAEIMACPQLIGMQLDCLCFSDLPVMLFEFPVQRAEKWFCPPVDRIASAYNATPLLAHIDRYNWLSQNLLNDFLSLGDVCFQVNCAGLYDKKTQKNLVYLLEHDAMIVLGSDAHNLSDRKPDFECAVRFFSAPPRRTGLFGHSLDPVQLSACISSSVSALSRRGNSCLLS